MADARQLRTLRQGVADWNNWKEKGLEKVRLSEADLHEEDLQGADLRKADLSRADLCGANLSEANLSWADLRGANLRWADLSKANLYKANLAEANLCGAYLHGANFHWANLTNVNLSGADLCLTRLNIANLWGANLHETCMYGADLDSADLTNAILVGTDLENANLTNCRIFGISAWELKLKCTTQKDLIITPRNQPAITVDNLEVAQFIYLLLHNEKIRDVIDTITSKAVLILGRFTPERKVVLDAIREELRKRGYLPILFDFEGPASRDITETVSTLAHMARFVIADITYAKSVIGELEHIVPQLSVPVQPLIRSLDYEYGLFGHIRKYPWVLETYRYENQEKLIISLEEKVIAPAEAKVNELRKHGR